MVQWKTTSKIATEVLVLFLLGYFFGSGTFQLFVSSYFGNIKNIDFIVIPEMNGGKDYEIVEKPILLTQSGTLVFIDNGYNKSILNTGIESSSGAVSESGTTDSEASVDLARYYSMKLDSLKKEDSKYSGGYFVNELDTKGVSKLNMEQIQFPNGRISPVVQSIGSELPMEKVGRTYFNTNTVYLDDAKTMKAFIAFAHSNYGKGGVEIGEELLKTKQGDILQVGNVSVEISEVITQSDKELRFDKVLEKYWNGGYDIVFYTCVKMEGKVLGKRFFIGKKI